MGSWSDIDRSQGYRTWRVYGDSKLANILHAEALASRLRGSGVVAHSVHPGSVRTSFGRDGDTTGATGALMQLNWVAHRLGLLLSPAEGAATPVHVATAAEAGATSGLYWRRCRPARVAPWARRPGAVALAQLRRMVASAL
ncbi:MAG: hypothetical protein R2716_13360 [Microthrixaceae bacterium]